MTHRRKPGLAGLILLLLVFCCVLPAQGSRYVPTPGMPVDAPELSAKGQYDELAALIAKHGDEFGDSLVRYQRARAVVHQRAAIEATQAVVPKSQLLLPAPRQPLALLPERAQSLAAKTGETAFTKAGRDAHKLYNPGPNYDLKVRLPSGKKPDAVDFDARIVRELKPNNPRAIQRGERQVEQYRKELEETFGGDWKSVVDTYNR